MSRTPPNDHSPENDDGQRYWLDDPRNVDKLFRALSVHFHAPNQDSGRHPDDHHEFVVRSMGTGPQVSRVKPDFFG